MLLVSGFWFLVSALPLAGLTYNYLIFNIVYD